MPVANKVGNIKGIELSRWLRLPILKKKGVYIDIYYIYRVTRVISKRHPFGRISRMAYRQRGRRTKTPSDASMERILTIYFHTRSLSKATVFHCVGAPPPLSWRKPAPRFFPGDVLSLAYFMVGAARNYMRVVCAWYSLLRPSFALL